MRLSELPAGRFADMLARAYAAGLQEVVQRLPAMLPPASNGHAVVSLTDLAAKLTLSLMEASQLSGLSRGHLREAIEEKKLKARIIGRGWRVKRDDLEAYVKKL
jgi:excisionase family DNA binding protein